MHSPPTYPRELEAGYDSTRPAQTFFRLLAGRPRQYLAALALYVLKMGPVFLSPVVLAESIRLVSSGAADAPRRLALLYAAFALSLAANIPLHILFVRVASGMVRGMELRLRAALVRRLQHLSMRFHGERESGRLQSKVLRDVEEIVRCAELAFHGMIGTALAILYAFGYALAQEPWVAAAYLVAGPVCAALMHLFRGAMRRRNDALRTEMESMSQRVSEMIELVPVTRAHGLEEAETAAVGSRLESVRERGFRVDEINAFFASSSFVVFHATVACVIALAAWMALRGQIGPDKIALYASLFQLVVGSLNGVVMMLPQVSKGLSSIRSIGEVLECPDLEENEGRHAVAAVRGAIEFREVSVTYPGAARPAVSRFSLAIPPGACVAFVGESGSGKSTLMQLAIGFLRPQEGTILLDGEPMDRIDMRTWRRHIAVVPQQTILFSGTIRQNITYGIGAYRDSQVWSAIDAAQLREVVEQMPDGLETRVGENGVKLSGGQRQRLAIARALVRDPRVIVLDEATSALDVVSEREVQAAIDNLVKGRTTLIVAHRLSTIRQAGLVVVMAAGEIAESGSHEELLARGGAFARFKALQS